MITCTTIELSLTPRPSSVSPHYVSLEQQAHGRETGVSEGAAHPPGGVGSPPQVHVPPRVRLRERSCAPVVAGLSRAGGAWKIPTRAGERRRRACLPRTFFLGG